MKAEGRVKKPQPPFRRLSGLQRPVEKRQAHVHAVIDVGVVVGEFLVAVPDSGRGEARGQDARSVVDVVLVAPAAVDIDAAKRLEVVPISRDEVDRVVLAPLPPALLYRLPRLEVERNAEAERR